MRRIDCLKGFEDEKRTVCFCHYVGAYHLLLGHCCRLRHRVQSFTLRLSLRELSRKLSDGTPDILIAEEALGEKTWAVFYRDQTGKVSCAIVEKTRLSFELVSHASMTPDVERFHCHTFQKENDCVHLLWDFADADVKEIFADGSSCKIIDAIVLNTRIFWIFGNFLAEPSKGPNFEIIREF